MTKRLQLTPIETQLFELGANLSDFILSSVPPSFWKEDIILAITSKVVSLSENRLVPRSQIPKIDLIKNEAEEFLGEMNYGSYLTIKHGALLASAGIDESNSQGDHFILLPKDPFVSAFQIREKLTSSLGLKNLGIIITDSKTGPLRYGVSGISLGVAGFHPVSNIVGKRDLFHRPLKMTQVNIADSLAAAAVLVMGEANESQPLVLIENAQVQFSEEVSKKELMVDCERDMYLPLYQHLLK